MDATTDLKQIRRWWKEWLDANIGMPTGKHTGLLTLDGDVNGLESLDRLEEARVKLPPSLTTGTGCGGRQRHFRYPEGADNPQQREGARGRARRARGGRLRRPPAEHHR